MLRFDMGTLIQGQTRIAKLKSAHNLLFVLEVGNVKLTYRKSLAKNLLTWSDLTLGSLCNVKRWLIGFLVDTLCIMSPMR